MRYYITAHTQVGDAVERRLARQLHSRLVAEAHAESSAHQQQPLTTSTSSTGGETQEGEESSRFCDPFFTSPTYVWIDQGQAVALYASSYSPSLAKDALNLLFLF